MPRYYVSMTWDDWPEGGSYGTVVEAESHEAAETAVRWMMAESRAEETVDVEDCVTIEQEDVVFQAETNRIFSDYSNSWHLVDCFDLDEFITAHQQPPSQEPS